jgi:hypothetical protein
MTRKAIISAGFAALLGLVGCATPYQQMGREGGFASQRLSVNTFSVTFMANGFTSADRAGLSALLRAAEITQECGFQYFVVLTDYDRSGVDNVQVTTPGYTHGTVTTIGNFTTFSATTTPATTYNVPVYKPGLELIIRCYNSKPSRTETLTARDYQNAHTGTVFYAPETIFRVRVKLAKGHWPTPEETLSKVPPPKS